MRLAAIDIGSNAARLLISDVVKVNGGVEFRKLNLVRVPLRLGFDVFDRGKISPEKAEQIVKTIKAYKILLDIYGVVHIKACATSAMREAKNAKEIISRIKFETGIEIKVISGDEEAGFIYENHFAETLSNKESYLYIDVGGGSTEVTLFGNNEILFKKSFDLGTIRILKNQVNNEHWDEAKKYLRKQTRGFEKIIAIGSGGNINKIFSMSRKKEGKTLTLEFLENYFAEFKKMSVEERIQKYNLKEDRADVIVPALQIYCTLMKCTGANEIFVPKIGLADGLIHSLYDEVKIQNILV